MRGSGWHGPAVALPAFFALKVLSGLALLKCSAAWLPLSDFPVFTQFLLLAALLNMVAVGGAQNGIVREAAHARVDGQVARTRAGGIALWGSAAVLIGLPVAAAAHPLALLLTGVAQHAWAVPLVALATFAGGSGQIDCAILTGRGRVLPSLAAQGAGLVAGTLGAMALLYRGQALGAVIAFAAGPLLTAAIAWPLVHRTHIDAIATPWSLRWAEARRLLGFSGAFVVVAAFSALTFFGLRYAYREAFGLDQLGLWLVANRISDTSTQLLGLFVVQVFVPRYTPVAGTDAGRRVALACWAVAAATFASFLAVFALVPGPLVTLFLSRKFVPAIGFILAYMTGDVLRVWGSMAMNAAFAQARLIRYVLIEVLTVTLFAVVTLALIALHQPWGPAIAYPAAYGTSAVIITLAFWRTRARA